LFSNIRPYISDHIILSKPGLPARENAPLSIKNRGSEYIFRKNINFLDEKYAGEHFCYHISAFHTQKLPE
jgi:hypothetical protein